MKYDETEASKCRYGDVAARVFTDTEILWEHSIASWQGEAAILAMRPDGSYLFYEWEYGSCSGCDGWEAAGYSDDQIYDQMNADTLVFHSLEDVAKFMQYRTYKPDFLFDED